VSVSWVQGLTRLSHARYQFLALQAQARSFARAGTEYSLEEGERDGSDSCVSELPPFFSVYYVYLVRSSAQQGRHPHTATVPVRIKRDWSAQKNGQLTD
jgi:hypothetical protein